MSDQQGGRHEGGAFGSARHSNSNINMNSIQQASEKSFDSCGAEGPAPQQMSLTSDEVNYLIFRYLQESGFVHSAFSFAHESMLGRTGLRSADKTLPAGALITFLQKGLQYVGIEETLQQQEESKAAATVASASKNSLNNNSNHAAEGVAGADFSLLSPPTLTALARSSNYPPIVLNVPAASAAAALKARLEAEAKLAHVQQQQQAQQQLLLVAQQQEQAAAAAELALVSNDNHKAQSMMNGPSPAAPQQPSATSTTSNKAIMGGGGMAVASSSMPPFGAVSGTGAGTTSSTISDAASAVAAAAVNRAALARQALAAQAMSHQLQHMVAAGAIPQQQQTSQQQTSQQQNPLQQLAGVAAGQQQQRQQLQQHLQHAAQPMSFQQQSQQTFGAAADLLAFQQLQQQQRNLPPNALPGAAATPTDSSASSIQRQRAMMMLTVAAGGASSSNESPAVLTSDAVAVASVLSQQLQGEIATLAPKRSAGSNKKLPRKKKKAKSVASSGVTDLQQSAAVSAIMRRAQQQEDEMRSNNSGRGSEEEEEDVEMTEGGSGGGDNDEGSYSNANVNNDPYSSQHPPAHQHPLAVSAAGRDLMLLQQQQHQQQLLQQQQQQQSPFPAAARSAGLINGEYDRNGALLAAAADKGVLHDHLPPHHLHRNGGVPGGSRDLPSSYEGEAPPPYDEDDGGVGELPDDSATAASPDEVLQLQMHESEVFMCAWNPVFTNLIATGSGDASARIWEMNGGSTRAGIRAVKTLPHGTDPRDKKNKDVTTLEWSSNGEYLATGSYDGVARVWSRSGALLHTLRKHSGPIFSLKWNKRGNYILSGSYDTTAIVWDVSEPKPDPVVQQFTDHEAPALDVDWRDNETFASCSTDKNVHLYRIGEPKPLKVYKGHSDEVNAVKWDPSGKYLASCSDDCTAKIWEVENDRPGPLYDFTSHSQEIYTVKWSPTGTGSSNPDMRSLLATASFDGTVRLWNVRDGSCFRIFNRHRDSVYSVSFAPSGEYLASGSLAGQMYIWNIERGMPVKSFKGSGDIFEVAWNKEETMVAACFSSNVVAVIDFDRSSVQ